MSCIMQPAAAPLAHTAQLTGSIASPSTADPSSVSGPHTRKRGREQAHSSPLRSLLEQIRRLKLPSIDAATADELLAPFIKQALQFDIEGTLLAIVRQFGWQADGFTTGVDLGSFSLLLQKYRYERLQELGSGSYAVVYKARNRETDEVIALKKLRFGFDEQGLPSSTLREISLLKELKHPNIVELKDIIYGFGTNNVYVVLECLDCDLRDLLDGESSLEMWRVKSFLYQILKAVHHAHMHCVMHRDLKPQNILVDASQQQVKVADFGLARSFLPPFKAYTDKVVTLWYRAPELLLGIGSYSSAIDMWSVGCILVEMLNREPLFRAESEIGLLHKIFEALGTPNDGVWTGVERLAHYRTNFPKWQQRPWSQLAPRLAADALGVDLLASMLAYNPEARITAGQALKHAWFDEVRRHELAAGAGSDGGRSLPGTQPQPHGHGGSSAAAGAAAAATLQRSAGDSRLLQYGVRAVQQQEQQQQVLAQQRHQLQQQAARQQQGAVMQQAASAQLQVCGLGLPAGLPQGALLQPASTAAAAAGSWSNPLNVLPPAAF
ncbi:kinase-like domain-containing protein [Scenedesmus sp. NREL 46B-D3]|nr:kinase-like domain-containing protein [Scenedesmus sp. NREL 46B-D3]